MGMTVRVVQVIILCIEFGVEGYRTNHVRFVPHRTFLLTNGRELPIQLEVLFTVFWFGIMSIWFVVSLVCCYGIETLWRRYKRRPIVRR